MRVAWAPAFTFPVLQWHNASFPGGFQTHGYVTPFLKPRQGHPTIRPYRFLGYMAPARTENALNTIPCCLGIFHAWVVVCVCFDRPHSCVSLSLCRPHDQARQSWAVGLAMSPTKQASFGRTFPCVCVCVCVCVFVWEIVAFRSRIQGLPHQCLNPPI